MGVKLSQRALILGGVLIATGGLWLLLSGVFGASSSMHSDSPTDETTPTHDANSEDSAPLNLHSTGSFLERIPPELIKRPETQALLNVNHVGIKGLLSDSKFGPDALVTAALELSRAVTACLSKDSCGQRPNPAHVFFSPNRTPAHRALNHSLLLLTEAAAEKPALLDRLSFDELLAAMRAGNPRTQLLALDLYLGKPINEETYDRLLQESAHFEDDAASDFFARLQEERFTPPARRAKLMHALEKAFARDSNALTFLLQRLPQLRLSEGEFKQVGQSLCRFKSGPRAASHWPMTSHSLDNYAQSHGFALNSQKLCSQ